jgi:hypothetical protein
MKKLIGVVAMTGILCFATVAAADPGSHPAPEQRAVENLEKNLANNPDNQGLKNALHHIGENIVRQSVKHNPGPKNVQSGQRPEGAEVVDRPERIDRAERIDRPDQAARPEHPTHPGRP